MAFNWTDIANGELGASVRNKLNLLGVWAQDNGLEKALTNGYVLVGNTSNIAEAVDFNSLALPVLIECQSGGAITAGQPVYISGTHASGKPIVALADNSSSATMPAIGLASQTVISGVDVLIQANGLLENVDTSAYTAGQALYINGAGLLTSTKPTGTALIQKTGVVSRSHASAGSIVIQGAGRSNDLPNLPEGRVWEGDANGVPQAVTLAEQSDFLMDTVDHASDFTAVWSTTHAHVNNSSNDLIITLPEATAADVGKEIKFWLEANPANHKVIFTGHSLSSLINKQASEGSDKAKAVISSNKSSNTRITAQCVGVNEIHITSIDSTYAALRHTVNFDSTSDSSPYSYLQLSAPVTDLMTSNADWWFAVKVEQPMTSDSDGQVLFGSNSFFVAYRGNGTYFMTSSTSGYLQTVSPNTIVQAGEWIIYQHDSSANTFEGWVNGVKALNGTTSGATPPSTAPTEMWIGSETGQASPPSGYGYPLTSCKISNIACGSGNLTDADAALLTHSVYRVPTLTGATLTNEWISNGSSMSNVVGGITLTDVGSNISHSEI